MLQGIFNQRLHKMTIQIIDLFFSRLQNMLGVSALFTWGVVPENNTNHLAVVPGGWVEENLQVYLEY